MNRHHQLTAAVIIRNEAHQLPTLIPALGFADEVLIVDGGSTDGSPELAARLGARVLRRPFDDFAAQRNFALDAASNRWVLALDADERPTRRFAAELRDRLRIDRHAAFRVRIASRLFGREVRFGGTQDDRPIRVVRRDSGRWTTAVHERFVTTGRVGRLAAPVTHEPFSTWSAFLAKVDRYTRLAVERTPRSVPAPGPLAGPWAAVRELVRRLLFKGGLFDGPAGFAFALGSAYSEALLIERLRDHRLTNGDSSPSHRTLPLNTSSPAPVQPSWIRSKAA